MFESTTVVDNEAGAVISRLKDLVSDCPTSSVTVTVYGVEL